MILLLLLWLFSDAPVVHSYRVASVETLPSVSEKFVYVRVTAYTDFDGPEMISVVLAGPDATGIKVGSAITVTVAPRGE